MKKMVVDEMCVKFGCCERKKKVLNVRKGKEENWGPGNTVIGKEVGFASFCILEEVKIRLGYPHKGQCPGTTM